MKDEIKRKKKRKHRVVKNSLVNLDDVTVAPGPNYHNWTPIVKTKIKVELPMELVSVSVFASVHIHIVGVLLVYTLPSCLCSSARTYLSRNQNTKSPKIRSYFKSQEITSKSTSFLIAFSLSIHCLLRLSYIFTIWLSVNVLCETISKCTATRDATDGKTDGSIPPYSQFHHRSVYPPKPTIFRGPTR